MLDDNHASVFHSPQNTNIPTSKKTVTVLLLASLLFGMLGGFIGSSTVLKQQSGIGGGITNHSTIVSLEEDSSVTSVVKKAIPAVVSVIISQDISKLPGFGFGTFGDPFQDSFGSSEPNIQQTGAGSGFLVTPDGLIATNRHVVSEPNASYEVVTSDGQNYPAKVVTVDPVNDLAFLKIDIKNAPTLNFSNTQPELGQRVIAIGNSLGQYENTVTTGIVSGIGRSIQAGSSDEGVEQLEGVIQTDAAINPGNSGGPLLDVLGNVVGINTAIDRNGQSVGFAIPASDVSKAMASYQKNGKIIRPYLGVRYVILSKILAERSKLPRNYGALIVRGNAPSDVAVIPGSPAGKAGLAENDIILEVNGHQITEKYSLVRALKEFNVGDQIELKVYHNGEEKTVKVNLVETP